MGKKKRKQQSQMTPESQNVSKGSDVKGKSEDKLLSDNDSGAREKTGTDLSSSLETMAGVVFIAAAAVAICLMFHSALILLAHDPTDSATTVLPGFFTENNLLSFFAVVVVLFALSLASSLVLACSGRIRGAIQVFLATALILIILCVIALAVMQLLAHSIYVSLMLACFIVLVAAIGKSLSQLSSEKKDYWGPTLTLSTAIAFYVAIIALFGFPNQLADKDDSITDVSASDNVLIASLSNEDYQKIKDNIHIVFVGENDQVNVFALRKVDDANVDLALALAARGTASQLDSGSIAVVALSETEKPEAPITSDAITMIEASTPILLLNNQDESQSTHLLKRVDGSLHVYDY